MQQLFGAVRFANQAGSAAACRSASLNSATLSLQSWHLILAVNASAAAAMGPACATRTLRSCAANSQSQLAQLCRKTVQGLLKQAQSEAHKCAVPSLSRSGKQLVSACSRFNPFGRYVFSDEALMTTNSQQSFNPLQCCEQHSRQADIMPP